MPFPFQIIQAAEHIVVAYEFASASRIIYMNRADYEAPGDAWMGYSSGRWEGDTLVVDVTDHVPDTWFDSAGNFHSDALKVVERYTVDRAPIRSTTKLTIEDPKVFTRPWTMSMPLYRRLEKNVQTFGIQVRRFCRGNDVWRSSQGRNPGL